MNLVAFGLILICCHVWAIEIDGQQTIKAQKWTKFEDFLERFKGILRNGDSSLGIPVLDPIAMSQLPLKIKQNDTDFEALLTNVKVDGLSAYTVNSGDFKLIGFKVTLDLTWPLVVATTNYSMKGSVAGFQLYGDGDINISAHNFRYQTEIAFSLNGNHLKTRQINSKISLGELDFRITGLFNNEEISELLSKLISDMVPQIIKDDHATIIKEVDPIIRKELDSFLATMTLADLLKLLGL